MKRVTLAVKLESENDQNIEQKQLNEFDSKLLKIKKRLAKVGFAQKMINQKREAHFDLMSRQNRRISIFSVVECIMMGIILFVQMIYIKNLISR